MYEWANLTWHAGFHLYTTFRRPHANYSGDLVLFIHDLACTLIAWSDVILADDIRVISCPRCEIPAVNCMMSSVTHVICRFVFIFMRPNVSSWLDLWYSQWPWLHQFFSQFLRNVPRHQLWDAFLGVFLTLRCHYEGNINISNLSFAIFTYSWFWMR